MGERMALLPVTEYLNPVVLTVIWCSLSCGQNPAWVLASVTGKSYQESEIQMSGLILHKETSLRRKVGNPCNYSCPTHSPVSPSLFAELGPPWAGFLPGRAVWAAVGAHRGDREHRHQGLCSPAGCSGHGVSSEAQFSSGVHWPSAKKGEQLPGLTGGRRNKVPFAEGQARQVFWLKTQPVREHRSVSFWEFFFPPLKWWFRFPDKQTDGTAKGLLLIKGIKSCCCLYHWESEAV